MSISEKHWNKKSTFICVFNWISSVPRYYIWQNVTLPFLVVKLYQWINAFQGCSTSFPLVTGTSMSTRLSLYLPFPPPQQAINLEPRRRPPVNAVFIYREVQPSMKVTKCKSISTNPLPEYWPFCHFVKMQLNLWTNSFVSLNWTIGLYLSYCAPTGQYFRVCSYPITVFL